MIAFIDHILRFLQDQNAVLNNMHHFQWPELLTHINFELNHYPALSLSVARTILQALPKKKAFLAERLMLTSWLAFNDVEDNRALINNALELALGI